MLVSERLTIELVPAANGDTTFGVDHSDRVRALRTEAAITNFNA